MARRQQQKKGGRLEIRTVFPASRVQEPSAVTGCRGLDLVGALGQAGTPETVNGALFTFHF